MNYDRVVSYYMESTALTLADDPLIEVTADTGAFEVISVEIGASEGTDPVDEVQEVSMWMGTVAGSGGSPITARVLRGEGTVNSSGDSNVTALGTGNEFYFSAYHTQNGWLYMPVPEARPLCKSGDNDVFAVLFPTAPDASMTISCTVVVGEW